MTLFMPAKENVSKLHRLLSGCETSSEERFVYLTGVTVSSPGTRLKHNLEFRARTLTLIGTKDT